MWQADDHQGALGACSPGGDGPRRLGFLRFLSMVSRASGRKDGIALSPRSHRDTVNPSTPRCPASSTCVKPTDLRQSFNSSGFMAGIVCRWYSPVKKYLRSAPLAITFLERSRFQPVPLGARTSLGSSRFHSIASVAFPGGASGYYRLAAKCTIVEKRYAFRITG